MIENIRKELEKSLSKINRVENEIYNLLMRKKNYVIPELMIATPTGGIINENLNMPEIAKELNNSGALAIMINTEPNYYKGSFLHLLNTRKELSNLPIIRRDFIMDSYQIAESKLAGSSAITIFPALTKENTKKIVDTSNAMGIEPICVATNKQEIEYLISIDVKTIMVSTINYLNMSTDMSIVNESKSFIGKYPKTVFILHGHLDKKEIKEYMNIGYNAFVINIPILTSSNPADRYLDFIRGI